MTTRKGRAKEILVIGAVGYPTHYTIPLEQAELSPGCEVSKEEGKFKGWRRVAA